MNYINQLSDNFETTDEYLKHRNDLTENEETEHKRKFLEKSYERFEETFNSLLSDMKKVTDKNINDNYTQSLMNVVTLREILQTVQTYVEKDEFPKLDFYLNLKNQIMTLNILKLFEDDF